MVSSVRLMEKRKQFGPNIFAASIIIIRLYFSADQHVETRTFEFSGILSFFGSMYGNESGV